MPQDSDLFTRVKNEQGYAAGYEYPDVLTFQTEPFATVIPSRSPAFKVHRTEGLANSALAHHRNGAKYELINGTWTKKWEFNTNPTNCDNCGNLLGDDDKYTNHYGRNSAYLRSPLHKGSSIFAPFLCRPCYEPEKRIADDRKEALNQRAEARWKKKEQERKNRGY